MSKATKSNDDAQWAERFKRVKSIPKKESLKLLKPGTWIQVKWMDGPDDVRLVTVKPRREDWDVSTLGLTGKNNWSVGFNQIVAILGTVQAPEVQLIE